jgi:developmentally-regulated GTP-binding protein 2
MMLDATKGDAQRALLLKELEAVGIRVNQKPPNVYYKRKATGGIKFNSTVTMTKTNERTVRAILQDYKIHHCDILFREDATIDQFIDVLVGGRSYMPCVFVYNKVDDLCLEELDYFASQPMSIVISCHQRLNLDRLIAMLWRHMGLVRVYTKRRGSPPDFTDAIVMRHGATIKDVCAGIHRDLMESFKFALVWGSSAKHQPQRVGLAHLVEDEDVVMVVTKSGA